MDRDYYAILQVRRSASPDEIERAYERLSAQYDPETSKKPKASQRHAEVTEAYDALIDRERRRQYDRELSRREATPGSISPSEALSNRFVIASAVTIVASIMVVLAAILLLGGDDGGDTVAVVTGSPSVSPSPAPDSPPELAGEPVTTDTGLQYIDIVVGTGAQPTDTDSVEVWYTGWLQDGGTKFDSAVDRGSPSTFAVSGVVPGFSEGIKGMKEGGQRRLIIPPELGYGDTGSGTSVPPNSTLIFDVELLKVIPPATPVATVAPTAAPTPAP
jgi:peptidylprolyl isomerase